LRRKTKERTFPQRVKKWGGGGMAVMLKNSTGDGVKGRGAGDLRKDASEEIEAYIIIRIQ